MHITHIRCPSICNLGSVDQINQIFEINGLFDVNQKIYGLFEINTYIFIDQIKIHHGHPYRLHSFATLDLASSCFAQIPRPSVELSNLIYPAPPSKSSIAQQRFVVNQPIFIVDVHSWTLQPQSRLCPIVADIYQLCNHLYSLVQRRE